MRSAILVGLALVGGCFGKEWGAGRLLDAAAGGLSVSARGDRDLAVRVGDRVVRPPLGRLPDGARVVAARIAPYRGGVALGLVVRSGGEHTYHLLHDGTDGRSWILSDPIFRDGGEPFRVVDVHNPGGDTLQLTFHRGHLRIGGSGLEAKVYTDTCPLFTSVGVKGRTELVDLDIARPGR